MAHTIFQVPAELYNDENLDVNIQEDDCIINVEFQEIINEEE